MNNNVAELNKKISNANKTKIKLMGEVSDLESNIRKIESYINEYNNNKEILKNNNTYLNEIKTLNNEKKVNNETLQKCQSQIELINDELLTLNKKIDDLKNKLVDLKEELSNVDEYIKTYELIKHNKKIKTRIDFIELGIGDLEDLISLKETTINNKNTLIQINDQKITEMYETLDNIKDLGKEVDY